MDISVEMRNITKTFPGVTALSSVDLTVRKGSIHAIVGENGAGKSTLMKILGGVYNADSGDILLNGEKVQIKTVMSATKLNIGVIFQEFNLMPELSVAENIFISDLPKFGIIPLLKLKELKKQARLILEQLDIDIDPSESISNIRVSQQQMVEIAKVVSQNAEIIIMDEPTAALNNQEVEKLYEIIKNLKSRGKTILYISHRMKEIFDLSDQVTILRDGKFVFTKDTSELTEDIIVESMIGRSMSNFYQMDTGEIGETILSVDKISKQNKFEDISFEVKRGEILGIGGLVGCGNYEIAKAVYGLQNIDSGTINIEGNTINIRNPRDAMKSGIEFVTEDRKEAGIFPEMSVKENLSINIIRKISRFMKSVLNLQAESDLLIKYKDFMDLKFSNENQEIRFLSGGNQQKVVLSRALAGECKVLILLEPTRGIDVGAKNEIYRILGDLTKTGLGIILISSELPELIAVSDRVLVIWQGQLTGELRGDDITENNIMQCATGNKTIMTEVE